MKFKAKMFLKTELQLWINKTENRQLKRKIRQRTGGAKMFHSYIAPNHKF